MSRIILIDDDDDDLFLFSEALKRLDRQVDFVPVAGGRALLDALAEGKLELGLERQEIMLIDLNMPQIDGFTLIKQLRERRLAMSVPKLVYSTSENSQDIRRSYEMGVCGFLSKPDSIDAITCMAASLCAYWFDFVTLPSAANHRDVSL